MILGRKKIGKMYKTIQKGADGRERMSVGI